MKNEDPITTEIEMQTVHWPSSAFLGAAIGAAGLSLAFQFARRRHWALFVANWVPTILVLGVYNKIAKTFSAPFDEAQRASHGGEYRGANSRTGVELRH
jgi:hypothetical protein